MKKRIIVICLISLMLTGCQIGGNRTEQLNDRTKVSVYHYEPKSYQEYQVKRESFDADVRLTASYQGSEGEGLFFKEIGKIKAVYVFSGQTIKARTLMAEMACDDLDAEMLSYQDELSSIAIEEKNIKRQLETATKEEKEGLEQSLEDLAYRRKILGIRISETEEKISRYKIYAPYDCKVTSLSYPAMSYEYDNNYDVYTNESIFVVESLDKGFYVNSGTSLGFEVGHQAKMVFGGATYDVVLEEVTETESGSFIYRYVFAGEDKTLEDTGLCTLVIEDGKANNVVCIPKRCVHEAQGKTYVYVLDENGIRMPLEVTTGKSNDEMIEITSGLEEGDEIIYE